MISASRRIFFYWLLLIIPTLAVGAAALWLLHREQVHINEQAAAALAARQSAVEARTRLIAENIGVIMTDVQSGLMATLLAAPSSDASEYLSNWRRTNPLVHDVYVASSGGALRWGTPNAPISAWLTTAPWRVSVVQPSPVLMTQPQQLEDRQIPEVKVSDAIMTPAIASAGVGADRDADMSAFDVAKNDVQETSAVLEKQKEVAPVQEAADIKFQAAEVSGNISQYQSARAAIQTMANYNVNAISSQKISTPSSSVTESNKDSAVLMDEFVSVSPSVSEKGVSKVDDSSRKRRNAADADRKQKKVVNAETKAVTKSTAVTPSGAAGKPQPQTSAGMAIQKEESVVMSGFSVSPDARTNLKAAEPLARDDISLSAKLFGDVRTNETVSTPDLTGWTPWKDAAGELHLFGWRLTPRGNVLAVEVNLEAIASRLREVLPANVGPDESYALFKGNDAQVAQVGMFGRSKIMSSTGKPYEQALGLPGWRVIGHILIDESGSVDSKAILFVSSLLVGLFVLFIIGGGSLLMRQARLSAAESAQKTSFVANVSHEFKTPLTTIRLYSELLEQGRIRDEGKRAESLQTISRETQRLARLVNNVLDFSRLEQGRKKFDLAEFDLREEIAKIVDRHAPRIADAGLKLDLLRTAAPCVVKTDLDAVEQIVINLLDNACKYAASGGEVTVGVTKTNGAVTIAVADRGPGIPATHRDKIFEKFHRVDDKLTAAQGGAGLGLSIARQLARGLGGDISYVPREGGGSEFILILPVV